MDLCKIVCLASGGEGFIQLDNVDMGDPYTMDRKGESCIVPFQNPEPGLDVGCVMEVEPLARLKCSEELVNGVGCNEEGEEGMVTPNCLKFSNSNFP